MSDTFRKLGVVQHLELALRLAATSEGMTIDEIADALDISRRTAQRMRAALDSVIDIEPLRDGAQLRYRLARHLNPGLLAPTRQEMSELVVAARAMRDSGQTDRADLLDRLERRLLAAMRQHDRTRLAPDLELLGARQLPIIAAGPGRASDPAILAACQQALLSDTLLAFDYDGPRGLRHHEVAVRGLLIGPRSYLVADSNDWGAPMLLRLDRILGPAVTDKRAWGDPDFDLETFAAQSFGVFQEDPETIILRFDAAAAGEVEGFRFHPNQELEALDDGRIEVRFESGGLLELAQHLFTWRGAVEVLEPEALIVIMRDEVRRILKRLPVG